MEGLEEYYEVLRRRCVAHYVMPEFQQESGSSSDRIRFPALIEALARTSRETWFLRGPGGAGKTSFINAAAAALVRRDVACLRITPELLRTVGPTRDIETFVREQLPFQVPEQLWKARVRKRRVVLLIDGVNEIRREWGHDERWLMVKNLLVGGHRFPVVAVSRYAVDIDFGALDSRAVQVARFVPFSRADVMGYYAEVGLPAHETYHRTVAAGLDAAASNPLLMSLIGEYFRGKADGTIIGEPPRSRAELLMITLQHGLAHLPEEQRSPRAVGAIAAASAILSLQHPAGFTLEALKNLMLRSGNAQIASDILVEAFPHTHLVDRSGDHYHYVHESLVDFGLALAYRDASLPPFSCGVNTVDHFLGNWVGCASDPARAAEEAARAARAVHRSDLLVDVLVANQGVLSKDARRKLWTQIGGGLVSSRVTRDRTADALGRLAPSQVRDALRSRLLLKLHQAHPAMAPEVGELLIDGAFSAGAWQKLRKKHERGWVPQQRSMRPVVVCAPTDLDSKIAARRFRAVRGLCKAPDVQLRDKLVALLSDDPDHRVRGAAAKALGILSGPGVLEPLVKALNPALEGVASVRGSAANALGVIADASGVSALLGRLDPQREPDASVRSSAADALGKIADPGTVVALVERLQRLKEPDERVRGSAASALGRIADPGSVDELVKKLDPEEEPAAWVRSSAAKGLGRIADPRSVAALLKSLDRKAEHDPAVRGAAANALGRIGGAGAVSELTQTLSPLLEPDAAARGSAANALGLIGDRAATAALARSLDRTYETDIIVRGSAANALGAIADPSGTEALRRTCEDPAEAVAVRSAALDALSRFALPAPHWIVGLAGQVRAQARAHKGNGGFGPLIGKIIEVLGIDLGDPAAVQWLRKTARLAADRVSRTAAVRALDAGAALDDDTVRFLIDDSVVRPDGRSHDTDNGVRGSVGAAVMRCFAFKDPPAHWLSLVAAMCSYENTWKTVIYATLAPLNRMNPEDGLRALAALQSRLPPAGTTNRYLLQSLERRRAQLEQKLEAERALLAVIQDPRELLMTFRFEDEACDGGRPDVVFIAAMGRERSAGFEELQSRGLAPTVHERDGRYYHRFELNRSGKEGLEGWLAQPTDQGPEAMQALVADVLALQPKVLLMFGVAGGVKERVRQGDVVMARQIHNYEPGKETETGFLARPQTYKCSAQLIDLANALHSAGVLDEILSGSRLHTDKDYASGEKVLMDPESEVRKRIESLSVDLIAFETEGHGMLHPLWEGERKRRAPVLAALIKTITDLGDASMVDDKAARQHAGTLRAMRVALALVQHL